MIKLLTLILGLQVLTGCGCETVEEGFRGIRQKWGKVENESLTPGIYFYNPISSSIKEFEVREKKTEGVTSAFTMDTQTVQISFAMTYYPDPPKAHEIYSQFGWDWAEKIIVPPTLGAIKDVVGKYRADDLVGKREEAKTLVFNELSEILKSRNVFVTRLDFVNLDFDDAYEKAVEAKVVAVQRAAESKNKTVEVEEQSKQAVISAKAQAESMRIRSEALKQNQGLVEYEAVQRWDGKLPQYMMGNSVPFINFDKN